MESEDRPLRVVEGNSDNIIVEELETVEGQDVLSEEIITKIYKISDEFQRQRVIMSLESKAKAIGQYRNFNKLCKIVSNKVVRKEQGLDQEFSVSVKELNLHYNTGEWIVDNQGVRRYTDKMGTMVEEQASWQFVVISNLYYNTEMNTYRVQLAFRESDLAPLKTITVNKSIIANSSNITILADYGLAVTNQTAPLLVKYLSDLERLNVDAIPKSNAISRLGWIDDDFVPYNNKISFDGESVYGELYNAIDCKGSFEDWKEMVKSETSLSARIALATSFASPLVKVLDCLTFFTHLWGNTGNGKTVALHLAQSVWGNPQKLVQNLNSTAVGLERLAGFFCNLPLCLDELQTLKKSNFREMGNYDEVLYRLGQGKGKNRGKKDGSIDKVPTWSLAILTTGEEPITNDSSGGGARNRVLDVYCGDNVFENAPNVAKTSHQNYGWAGVEFIMRLRAYIEQNTVKPLYKIYDRLYNYVLRYRPTDKQAMSATMVTMGYVLMQHFIFDYTLDVSIEKGIELLDEMKDLLISVNDINNVMDFYDGIMAFVAQNNQKFLLYGEKPEDKKTVEIFGKIESGKIFILNNVVKKFCVEHLFSYRKIITQLQSKDLIEITDPNTVTRTIRINGVVARCICFRLNQTAKQEKIDVDMIPATDEESDLVPF